ncbi:MAG TPA: triose-phosphate isomerase [Planctomycetota bacterium]|nr:triose-phosphate isomerase [Planctomycetota bacterium]
MTYPAQSPSTSRRGVLIAGNWKMYKTGEEAVALAGQLLDGLPEAREPLVAVFPPATALSAVAERLRGGRKEIVVGAQNIHFEKEGAFTGEISAEMVRSAGAHAVILGHSERRHVFGESDEVVGRKVARALEAGLFPILCVGEKLEERESGSTSAVVARQLEEGIRGVSSAADLARIVLAYEPVWAIGTGKTATPAQGQEVHQLLRSKLRAAFQQRGGRPESADDTLILYGGSVKPENAAELLAESDIDGLLVGGASLKADSFLKICRAGA